MKKLFFALGTMSLLMLSSCGNQPKEGAKTEAKTETAKTGQASDCGSPAEIPQDQSAEIIQASSVKAEEGGEGFEAIAQSLGFQTNAGKEYVTVDPTKCGVFRDHFPDYPQTLRPYGPKTNTLILYLLENLTYGSDLLTFNFETNKWERGLADYWKFSEDGSSVILRINPNIKFSDGSQFTVDDIIATNELLRSQDLGDALRKGWAENQNFKKISPFMVEVTLTKPGWIAWLQLNNQYMRWHPKRVLEKIDPKTYIDKYNTEFMPVLGPYVFDAEKSVDQQLIVLKRNPNWWGNMYPEKKKEYNFNSIEYTVVRDESIAQKNFLAGDLDIYTARNADWWYYPDFEKATTGVAALKQNLIVKKVLFNGALKRKNFAVINTRVKPFDDIRIRKAIAFGFNKDPIIDKIFHNDVVKIYSIAPLSPWEAPDLNRYGYDPAAATALLDEAGYSIIDADGVRKNEAGERLEFEMVMYQDPVNEKVNNIFQEDMKNIGIKINITKTDFSTAIQKLDEYKFNIMFIGNTYGDYPEFDQEYYSSLADSPGTYNQAGFKNARADELIDIYLSAPNIDDRYKAAHELDKLVADYFGYIETWTPPYSVKYAAWNRFNMASAYMADTPARYWSINADKEAQVQKGKSDASVVMDAGQLMLDPFNLKPADYNATE